MLIAPHALVEHQINAQVAHLVSYYQEEVAFVQMENIWTAQHARTVLQNVQYVLEQEQQNAIHVQMVTTYLAVHAINVMLIAPHALVEHQINVKLVNLANI